MMRSTLMCETSGLFFALLQPAKTKSREKSINLFMNVNGMICELLLNFEKT
jgi:hypothetical protein